MELIRAGIYTKRWRVILFTAIAAVNLIIYYPSLYHVPRADQWCYLADTAGYDDLYSLITKFYSYNRVRYCDPGDEILFRPITFILLGTEKWAFSTHFFYWQLTGIILHLILVWWLLKLLLEIRPSIFAYLLALFFSTISVIQEMVIWHHINGYILFMIFILGALYHSYSHVLEGQTKKWRIGAIIGYLTLACFTHELGIALTLLLILYLFVTRTSARQLPSRKWICLLLIPVILYFSMDYLDSLAHPSANFINSLIHPPTGAFISGGSFSAKLWGAANAFWTLLIGWIFTGIFPLVQHVLTVSSEKFSRLYSVLPFSLRGLCNNINFESLFDIIGFIAGLTLLSILSGMIGRGIFTVMCLINRKNIPSSYSGKKGMLYRQEILFLADLMLLLAVFLLISIFGRGHSVFKYGPRYGAYAFNMYYPYIFWVLFTIIVYVLHKVVGFESLPGTLGRYLKSLAVIAILSTSIANAYNVFDVNIKIAEMLAPTRLFIEKINDFVSSHHGELDFTFKLAGHPAEDEQLAENNSVGIYMSDILYRRYLNPVSPKYLLDFPPGDKH